MQLGVLFEALPAISPHPTWLDELVQICATQSSQLLMTRSGSSSSSESASESSSEDVNDDMASSMPSESPDMSPTTKASSLSGDQRQRSGLWSKSNGGSGPVLQSARFDINTSPQQDLPEPIPHATSSSATVNGDNGNGT